MRIISNPKSSAKNEITILAIIETLASVVMTYLIYLHFNKIDYIKYCVLIAPFLLLRSPLTTQKGIVLFNNYVNFVKSMRRKQGKEYRLFRSDNIQLFFVNYILLVLSGFVAILIRVYIVLCVAIRHPIYSLSQIPINWYRTTLATDFFHPPEIVPGAELNSKIDLKWSVIKQGLISQKTSIRKKVFLAISITPILILHYIPSYVYRLSLKSTSIIYLPLIFIVYPKPSSISHSKFVMLNIRESAFEKIKRNYSIFSLCCLMILPFFIKVFWQSSVDSIKSQKIIIYFMPMAEISSWHITSFISASLTIVLFFMADQMRIKVASNYKVEKLDSTLILWLLRLRSLSTIWTIFCGIYLISTSDNLDLIENIKFNFPHIQWLPWHN